MTENLLKAVETSTSHGRTLYKATFVFPIKPTIPLKKTTKIVPRQDEETASASQLLLTL